MIHVVIVGAGGFGREIYCALQGGAVSPDGERANVLGFIDDAPSAENVARVERLGSRVLGPTDVMRSIDSSAQYVIGVGATRTRRAIDQRLSEMGFRAAPAFIHQSAWLGIDVQLADGAIVCAGVKITTNVRIGRHAHVNLGCTVGHDTYIGDFVTIAPLCGISGNVRINDGAELGTGVSVIPHVSIDEGCMIGAGAVVARDVQNDVVAVGMPAQARRPLTPPWRIKS